MNAEGNNENFDELISQSIGREIPQFDFDIWKKAHKSEIQIFESQTIGGKALRYSKPPNIWRIIMNSKITKLATAAVVILAVVVGVTLIDRSATPVYAIEQTIQAMRSISSVRAYCTDWDDSKGEVWVQVDPETGQEEYHYSDQGNLVIVATPEKTYYYYKDKNLVRIRNEYVPASEVRISRLFEDLADSQGDFGEKELIINVDPKTKLPINSEAIKSAPGQGVKSVDRLEYNVPIPQGLFDFEIPEGAEVVYE
jgi:hypothetical protein